MKVAESGDLLSDRNPLVLPRDAHTFVSGGRYVIACDVTADVNLIKPSKNGANHDRITWEVTVETRPSLQLIAIETVGAYQLSIFNLLPGTQYFVEGADSLTANWAVKTNFTANSTATNILLRPTNPAATFYRVRHSN